MANIAIVYGTSEGQTKNISRHIERILAEAGHTIKLVEGHQLKAGLDVDSFDGILVGSPVHAGKHDKRIVEFVKSNLVALEAKPSAFYSVSMAARQASEKDKAEIESLLEQFSRRTGWHPQKMELFAGALMYTRYNPVIRFIMKKIAESRGGETDTSRNYEYTDWNGVTDFANAFMDTLPMETTAA